MLFESRPCSCQQWSGKASQMLTSCLKHRANSCQLHTEKASQMLTYILFKTQNILLSATSRKGESDSDLQPVQNPKYTLISNNQDRPTSCWLTPCWKPRACYCQQQTERVSQMLTYSLFKPQRILMSATCRKGQPDAYSLFKTQNRLLLVTTRKSHPDADLHPVQNPKYALVSNKG